MPTASVGVLARSDAGITKVFKTGFLVQDFVDGQFSGEAVLLAENCSDSDGSADWTFQISGQGITSLSCPRLSEITDVFLYFSLNQITTTSFPELSRITATGISTSGMTLANNPIGNISFPSLESITGDGSTAQLDISQNSQISTPIRTASFPRLMSITGSSGNTAQLFLYNNENLSLVEFPMLSSVLFCSIKIQNCALTQTSVNNFLIQLSSIDDADATLSVDLRGGTNAAPTGAGLVAKQRLIDAGCTIQTN